VNVIALSYGGGWQSVAMCVLVRQGKLPRPDLVGIADTGREVATTWEYAYGVMQPFLDPIGLKIEVVPHTLARVDLYAKDGTTLIPAYTKTENGMGMFGDMTFKEGREAAFCSGEWKRDTMERWYRLKGVKECVQWIGYSLDEISRVKADHRDWCHNEFPLIDLRVTRGQCGAIITAAGLPLPKKSRCWCCPHQTPEEWLEVRSRPEEFAAACELEREVNERDPEHGGELYLYSGRVPLALADFGDDAGSLPARPCADGHCLT
jgi:hypothetical protein